MCGLVSSAFQDPHEFRRGVRQPRAAAGNHINMARHTQLADFNFFHPAVLDFPLTHMRGTMATPMPICTKRLMLSMVGISMGMFERRADGARRARSPGGEGRFHDMADKGFLAEFFDVHFLAFGERMLRRNDESQLVLQNFRGLQLRIARERKKPRRRSRR